MKRYFISSAITFVTIFSVVFAAQLTSGAVTADNLTWGAVLSVIVTAARAGIKAIAELLIAPNS